MISNYNDNRETTKQIHTLWGVVGVFVHKYDLEPVKVAWPTFFISSGRHSKLCTVFMLGTFVGLAKSLHTQVIQMTLAYFHAYDTLIKL